MATAEEYAKMSDSEKKKEDWMNSKWRPMMGWSYMATCITDFVLFPILWSIAQMVGGGEVKMQWQPITLMGAGLYHVAMGAVLGLAAWGRTQEKLQGANNGGMQPISQSVTTTYGSPGAGGGFGSSMPSQGGFGSMNQPMQASQSTGFSGGFSAPVTTPSFVAKQPPAMSSTGKPMPVQPDMPEL